MWWRSNGRLTHCNHRAHTNSIILANAHTALDDGGKYYVVQMVENPPGHYIFQPASVTITAGSIVVWIDNSDAPHTVTSDPGAPSAFNTTQNVTQGKTFALQFNQAGTYHYHCNIHPTTMKAVIDVTT